MKTLLATILIAAAAPVLHAAAPQNAPSATAKAVSVTIDLSGIREAHGDLFVSLQTRDQFMQPVSAFGTKIARPAPGARSVVLEGVAPGVYAASIWHDVNGNNKWDEGGTSGEGWAMLNADKLRAKPVFDQVSFTVGETPARLKLDMRYGY